MRAEVLSLLALLATVVSVVVVLPQVWRTCRHGRSDGLALAHVWLAAVTSAVWVQYGLHAGATGAAVNAAVTGVLNAVLLVGLARVLPGVVTAQALRVLPATGAWLAAHGLLLAAGEAAVVGALTALGATVAALPQVVLMLRRPGLDVSGVSAASWWCGALTHACWLGYWVLSGQAVLAVPPGVGLAASLGVLALLAGARAGRRHPVVVLAGLRGAARVGGLSRLGAAAG